MRIQRHPVNAKISTSAASVGAGTQYPIGYTLGDYIDLFTNIRTIDFTLFSEPASQFFSISGDPIDMIQNAQNGINGSIVAVSGTSERQIKLMGLLNDDGSEPLISKSPFTTKQAPFFAFGGLGVVGFIDFSKTRFVGGLFYPQIEIVFSNGPSSNGAGSPISFISFGNQFIPIMSGDASLPMLVTGSLTPNERFDSIRVNQSSIQSGQSVTFTSENFDFSNISSAFFGSTKVKIDSAGKNQLTLTLPVGTKSGPIRFESDGPHYDFFVTAFELQVAS